MKTNWPIGVLPVVLIVIGLVGWAAYSPVAQPTSASPDKADNDLNAAVDRVDAYFHNRWRELEGLVSEPADDLQVLRRLSLALNGTLPSLEEIRLFENETGGDRLARWTDRMLADDRFPDYFAERLARSLVGVENGQFIVFRRDRFVDWLRDQLKINRPYDEMARDMIAGQGLWTGQPQTNFITAGLANGELDENKLAGRSVRAFLGQRIDCAQCHDHPFDHWKQHDFEGLAAFYGQVRPSVVGVEDKSLRKGKPVEYVVEDRLTLEKRTVGAAVPFHPEWLPAEGTRREQLAAWITHPENRRFERAIANRIWGLLLGRPYEAPVDGLPDPAPENSAESGLLDILGADFREHACDLRRLMRVIASSEPFRLASTTSTADPLVLERLDKEWAVFPLTRLRPEQVIGSMLQAASIKSIDRNSHLFVRFIRAIREKDFIQEYGDPGENELDQHSGTIPQALLRLNGKLSREISEAGLLSASGRIASMATSDDQCVELCYLVCLTRRPIEEERNHFLAQLRDTRGKQRNQVVEDMYWALFNSPEFSWNH